MRKLCGFKSHLVRHLTIRQVVGSNPTNSASCHCSNINVCFIFLIVFGNHLLYPFIYRLNFKITRLPNPHLYYDSLIGKAIRISNRYRFKSYSWSYIVPNRYKHIVCPLLFNCFNVLNYIFRF